MNCAQSAQDKPKDKGATIRHLHDEGTEGEGGGGGHCAKGSTDTRQLSRKSKAQLVNFSIIFMRRGTTGLASLPLVPLKLRTLRLLRLSLVDLFMA